MMLHVVVILTQTETKEKHLEGSLWHPGSIKERPLEQNRGFNILLKHSNFATIIQGSFQGCCFDVGLFPLSLCPVAFL